MSEFSMEDYVKQMTGEAKEVEEKSEPFPGFAILTYFLAIVLVTVVILANYYLVSYTAFKIWVWFAIPVLDFVVPQSMWLGLYLLLGVINPHFRPNESWGETAEEKGKTVARWTSHCVLTPVIILAIAYIAKTVVM